MTHEQVKCHMFGSKQFPERVDPDTYEVIKQVTKKFWTEDERL